MIQRVQLAGIRIIDLLRESKKSFFRVEALESYNIAQEEEFRRRYYGGQPLPPLLDSNKEWYKLMTKFAQEGRPSSRVKVVSRKLSPYSRLEMEWWFNQAVQYGECINILLKEQFPRLAEMWNEEYYVVDDMRLVYLQYDSENRFVGLEEEKDTNEIERRLLHKQQLLNIATPYESFLAHARSKGVLEIPDIPQRG